MTMTRPVDVQKIPTRSMGERDWGLELLVASTDKYIGKVLYMNAGKAGGLQKHAEKIETFHLFDGRAWVDHDTGDGEITRTLMLSGETYHVPAGAVHRVEAITDCVFFEVSTPVFDDRIRCEAEYGEPEVGGLPSTR